MQPNETPQSPDEKRKDTSLPGREEEVIVNTQEQKDITNTGAQEATNESTTIGPAEEKSAMMEKTFKEGLDDNSNTEDIPDDEEK